ncbi:unnamed protein product [Polarella glacialis]|uniref:Steroid 5-alpha reductase C-terminal domain-containing protein n=1 Tax=Polarella glacialis TaxID=89957 RepID=A0A813EBR0_POLGL|nr:unnamed protein product [Polarella glacialis]
MARTSRRTAAISVLALSIASGSLPAKLFAVSSTRRPVVARGALPVAGICAACTLPTCLGFWRSEYGVSYGYGGAVALAGALLLQKALATALGAAVVAQALCLVLYGSRLNLFLLYRELCIPRFTEVRNRIEAKAAGKGGRLKRLPFVLGCSFLYLGLAAPAALSVQAGALQNSRAFVCCVAAMYLGWALAASGDLYKSARKAARGETALITGGPYALLRHPNYTGEQLLWTANFAAGVVAVAGQLRSGQRLGAVLATTGWWLLASMLGLLGISFVLMQAARNLEKRQLETYGQDPSYQSWVKRTWAGFSLSPRPASAAAGEEKDAAEKDAEE